MRADFCTFLLAACSCLKEYGNISFMVNPRLNYTFADSNSMNNLCTQTSAPTLVSSDSVDNSHFHVQQCQETVAFAELGVF